MKQCNLTYFNIMEQPGLERIKRNVRELTDLIYDRDEIVFFQQRIQFPRALNK